MGVTKEDVEAAITSALSPSHLVSLHSLLTPSLNPSISILNPNRFRRCASAISGGDGHIWRVSSLPMPKL